MKNCDNICLVKIKGWQVVAQKNLFKVNDKCIYIEIDSILPVDNIHFADFEGKCIKTKKIRGELSQGVVFPLDILPEIVNDIKREELPENTNLTEVLNILKYDDSGLSNDKPNAWPSNLPKTDEERIQNIFKDLKNSFKEEELVFIETEKLDGTSFTAFLDSDKLVVCSRNYIVDEDNDLYKVALNTNVKDKLIEIRNKYNLNAMLQGECIGPKIQNNRYKLNDRKVFFFRMFNINDLKFVDFEKFLDIAKDLNILTVPIINYNYVLPENIKILLNHVNGNSALCKTTKREGSVFIMKNKLNYNQNRLSFKAISNEFLLKQK